LNSLYMVLDLGQYGVYLGEGLVFVQAVISREDLMDGTLWIIYRMHVVMIISLSSSLLSSS